MCAVKTHMMPNGAIMECKKEVTQLMGSNIWDSGKHNKEQHPIVSLVMTSLIILTIFF